MLVEHRALEASPKAFVDDIPAADARERRPKRPGVTLCA